MTLKSGTQKLRILLTGGVYTPILPLYVYAMASNWSCRICATIVCVQTIMCVSTVKKPVKNYTKHKHRLTGSPDFCPAADTMHFLSRCNEMLPKITARRGVNFLDVSVCKYCTGVPHCKFVMSRRFYTCDYDLPREYTAY